MTSVRRLVAVYPLDRGGGGDLRPVLAQGNFGAPGVMQLPFLGIADFWQGVGANEVPPRLDGLIVRPLRGENYR